MEIYTLRRKLTNYRFSTGSLSLEAAIEEPGAFSWVFSVIKIYINTVKSTNHLINNFPYILAINLHEIINQNMKLNPPTRRNP